MKSISTFQLKTEKETGSSWRSSIVLTLSMLMLSVVAFAKTPQCTPPVATISGNLNLCGASAMGTFNATTLTAASNIVGSTFAWSTGETLAAITTATPGIYTVTATALGGCTASASVTVRGISPTTGGSIGYDQIICGIPGTPAAIVSIAPASGQPAGYAIEYVWITTTDINTVNGTATNMTMIAGATGETYAPGSISVTTWYRRCARVAGCTIYSAETNWVKKEPRPAATANITGVLTFCAGNSSVLTATGGVSYVWNTGATTAAITVATAGTYTVTATNAAGCTATKSVTVTVNALPIPVITGTTTFCAGGSSVLTATGGASYVWNTGATTAAIMVATAGTYTVTATNAAGCTATKSVTVTVNPLPTPVITGTTTFCAGNSSVLTATGGASYVWNTGATSAAITVATAGTYTVTATNAAGCTATKSVTVTVNALPTPAITGNLNLCDGYVNLAQSTTLTATGGVSYVWSTGAVTASISTNTAGVYTVTATNANGCTRATSVMVRRVSPTNPGSIGYDEAVCGASFDPANIVSIAPASGQPSGMAIEYVWLQTTDPATANGTASNFTTISGATGESYNPTTISVTTWYRRCARTAGCLIYSAETNWVKKQPLSVPTPVITGTTTFCAGASSVLTATGGASYLWNTGATTAAITVANAGTYTVTATNASGCTATKSVTVTVNALPIPVITGTTTFCAGNSSVLTATGGASYLWNTGATTAAITVANAGTYTVTATNAAGCTATKAVTVTVNPLPTPAITGVLLICNGGSTTLTATGGVSYAWSNGANTAAATVATTGTYTVTVTNAAGCTATASANVTIAAPPVVTLNCKNTVCLGDCLTATAGGGVSYLWNTGATTAVISLCPTTTTTYTVTVTNQYGCTATAIRTVTVFPKPVAGITGGAAICYGGSTTMTATGGATYTWSNGVLTAVNTVTPTATTTYTVTVANSDGCTATASKTIVVNALPVASITGVGVVCSGVSTTLTAAGGATYAWSTGATTAALTVTPNATTTYTVIVTATGGCTASATFTVVVNPTPTATITGVTNICAGRSTVLTAAGGDAYLWNTGASTAAITVAPVSNRTYTVTVTNIGGCTATKSITVTPNVLTLTPMAAVTICDGQSATVGYTITNVNYVWSNTATTGQITVTPSISTIYTVTATSTLGCAATASVTVNVNPRPDASVEGSTICIGNTATIYANTTSAGATYLWNTGSTDDFLSVAPSATTTYSVTITNINGCTQTASGSVVVNPLPTPSITGTTTICFGASTTLTATGGATYRWSNGGTTAAIAVTPTATSTYTVTVTSAAGCTATKTVTVTVNPLPVAAITGITTVCKGATATLTASGGAFYQWSNGTASAVLSVTPLVSTYYTVTVTNGFGCIATASQLVTVNALPSIAISGATALCAGSTTTLTASGGATYLWSNTSATAAITLTPQSSTNYTVTVTSSRGCTATKSVAIVVNPLPTVTASSATICAEQIATITATASAGVTYAWSNGNTTASIAVSPAASTIYTVTVTNQYGCTATATGAVRVNPLPMVSFADYPTTICKGACTYVCAMGGDTYAWSNGQTTSTISVCPTATTTYTVTVSNSRGCTITASRTITVNELPVVTFTGNSAVCAGGTATITANGGVSYLWSNGATTASISFAPASTQLYQVTVTSAAGCTAVGTKTVTVNALPTVVASCSANVCAGTTMSLSAIAAGATSFAWAGPAAFTAATQNVSRPNANATMSGTYIVSATSAAGCVGTGSVTTAVVNCNTQVGDFVWYDADQDGVQGGSEAGISGVTVQLYNSASVLVDTKTTDAFGEYVFEYVLPGTYFVKFSNLPASYVFTTQNAGTANGSDASSTGVTPNFTVAAGVDNYTIDAGAYPGYGNIGNYVWYDANHDGMQDGEAGIAGVEVRLYDALGTLLQTTVTDASGIYNFAVLPGTYSVSFYRSGWTLTTQTLNTVNGSDPYTNTGKTANFTVAAGQNRMDIDAGFVVCACGKTAAPNNVAAREISAPSTGFSVSRNSVSLYPNPVAASDLNVKVTTQVQDLNATIVVLDITGKVMFTQQTNLSEGTNYVRLDVTSLAEGTYLVQVRSSTAQFETQKFVRIQ